MLFLFSDVGPDDAPTKIRKGSHATIARELLPYGDAGATLRATLYQDTLPQKIAKSSWRRVTQALSICATHS